jgi:hypothetical protein
MNPEQDTKIAEGQCEIELFLVTRRNNSKLFALLYIVKVKAFVKKHAIV